MKVLQAEGNGNKEVKLSKKSRLVITKFLSFPFLEMARVTQTDYLTSADQVIPD